MVSQLLFSFHLYLKICEVLYLLSHYRLIFTEAEVDYNEWTRIALEGDDLFINY